MNKRNFFPIRLISSVLAIIFYTLLCACNLSFATTYYIASYGNDNNSGTSANPWRTINKANSSLRAGDTVFIREGRYQETIAPRNSGDPGNYITYKNFQDETVVITGVLLGIELQNVDYIFIEGITLDGISEKYEIKEWVDIHDSNHNIIQNCEMQYCEGWSGIEIGRNSQYNRIINNIMHHCGFPEPPASDDYGNCITLLGDHNLIEGNEISYGGHNLLEIRLGSYNIVRNNNLHSNWGRCASLQSDPEGNDSGSRHNVFEKNKVSLGTHWHNNAYPNPGLQCNQPHAIIRFNEFYDNFGHGLMVYCTQPPEGRFTKIYNNVFYRNGYNDRNIDKTGLQLIDWSQGKGGFQGVSVKNNIFYQNKLQGIGFEGREGTNQNHILVNNFVSGNPLFQDEASLEFFLQSISPCVNAGTFLTKTTTSGSGTEITVEDAGFFCDGFGLTEGDSIQLEGKPQPVKIIHVDYENNVITIDTYLSWNAGQGVSFPYRSFLPDIGAYEFAPDKKKSSIKR